MVVDARAIAVRDLEATVVARRRVEHHGCGDVILRREVAVRDNVLVRAERAAARVLQVALVLEQHDRGAEYVLDLPRQIDPCDVANRTRAAGEILESTDLPRVVDL